ncbi:MAG TPA: Ig-like domain-containing protein [Burkholderiaceae bacterium]|nr:Ig-like domain-containing protein [Burkholderiaceae bacterium]
MLAAACGSGSSAGGEATDSLVWITEPTEAQFFSTDQPTVRLAGGAFIPSGAACDAPIGTLPPGYVVRWLNEATGATGAATARLHCLLLPTVAWDTADISLAIGRNRLVVSVQSADGRALSDSLLVGRVPDTTPPRVVAIAPPAGAAFVHRATTIELTFSEPVDEDSLRRGWTVRAARGFDRCRGAGAIRVLSCAAAGAGHDLRGAHRRRQGSQRLADARRVRVELHHRALTLGPRAVP